jgi:death-on-curing protein
MDEPRWVTKEMVLAVHEEQMATFGGGAGLRDEGLLESALARPQNLFAYEPDATLPRLAASLGWGIVRKHPFVDGNKRTGLIAIRMFMHRNGLRFRPDRTQAYSVIMAVAAGELDEDELATWIAENSAPA